MRRLQSQKGFTYLMVLGWVALGGVTLVTLAQNWRFERQREREAEMVARGREIAAAIDRYHAVSNPGLSARFPRSLQELVEDRRGVQTQHLLRRAWVDPLTGRPDWGWVRAGSAPDAGFRGVYSRATGEPVRPPEGVRRYSDWQFVSQAGHAPAATAPPSKRLAPHGP